MKKLNKNLSNAVKSFDDIRFYGYFGLLVVITTFYTIFLSHW